MKTILPASLLLLCAAVLPAPAQELAAVAAQPAVLADARTSPDGCAVRVLPDGGFMVFATGSGTYDFDDGDDLAKARQTAQLAARANLAKFMKESLATESSLEESSEMVKSLSSSNGVQSVSVDKAQARKTLQTIKSSADARSELISKNEALVAQRDVYAGEIREANARVEKLSEQVVALEDELKRLPAAASEIADTQAAVFKIMQDEISELDGVIAGEQAEFEEFRRRHQARADRLAERRREILRRSGGNIEEMTRRALVERPEDPRTAQLRRELEELRRVHEKSVLDNEAKIRSLNDSLRREQTDRARASQDMRDVKELREEAERLREKLQLAEKELLNERQRSEELRQREAMGKQALMARLATLESPTLGTASAAGTNQSREAKLVKLPSWMRLKN